MVNGNTLRLIRRTNEKNNNINNKRLKAKKEPIAYTWQIAYFGERFKNYSGTQKENLPGCHWTVG